jgi:hypothetical protein
MPRLVEQRHLPRLVEQRQRGRTRTWVQPRTHAKGPGVTALSPAPVGLARVAVRESKELRSWPEVEQQADLEISGSKVVEELFAVRIHESLGRLELDDDLLLYHHISPEVPDTKIVVPHVDDLLTVNRESESRQLVGESLPIHGFQEAEAKSVVNTIEAPNDLACELGFQEETVCVRPRGSHPRESALTLLKVRNQLNAYVREGTR